MDSVKTKRTGIPVVEGFFTWPSEDPRLIAGKCENCGRVFFPKCYPLHRPDCREEKVKEIFLSKQGKLISYTWQFYPPPPPYKGPEPFAPFGIGMVKVPEGISIVGILDCEDIEILKIGMDVSLKVGELFRDENGNSYVTWKFKSEW